jgi:hypothetical protein
MRYLFNTKLALWFFNRYFNIPIDATIVQLSKNSIHYTNDWKTFKCRHWQVNLLEFEPFKTVQKLLILPFAYLSKGFAFLLLTDTTATNGGDTQLLVLAPTTNYGSDAGAWTSCDGGAQFHYLINFTLPSGSGSISSVTLNLYKTTNGGTNTGVNVEVHELTRTDWVEAQATWNIYKTSNNWTTAGGDYSATVVHSIAHTASNNVWRQWHLGNGATNPISGLTWSSVVNLLLLIAPESTTPQQAENYNTKESASNKPYIEITYTAGGAPTPPPVFIIFN